MHRKQEIDSYGSRTVRYQIVELEVYFYNKDNDDWPTYNRDCVAGQWFFHRSGVHLAFQTQHAGEDLTQFGGFLIRGLQRIVDGKTEGYIGGAQRYQFELFNAAASMPKICPMTPLADISIYKHRRVRIRLDETTGSMFRYFRQIKPSDWETPRKVVYTEKLLVKKAAKVVKYGDAPQVGMGEQQVFPMAANLVCFSKYITSYKCWNDIERALMKEGIAYELLSNTEDIWVRDFMPIQKNDETFVAYTYNPDYLQNEKKYITQDVRACFDFDKYTLQDFNLVVDGGNVILAGNKVIMTDKIFVENKHLSKEEIQGVIEKALERELVIIPWDKEEVYGHADGMVRYVSTNHVVINNYADIDESFRARLVKTLKPYFAEISELNYGANARVNSWAHLNFLQVGRCIFVPQLGIPRDVPALEQLSAIYKNHRVIPVRVDGIVRKRGALNCISWNIQV